MQPHKYLNIKLKFYYAEGNYKLLLLAMTIVYMYIKINKNLHFIYNLNNNLHTNI
jgi:hypothetical protein